jgi:hypothetical protein
MHMTFDTFKNINGILADRATVGQRAVNEQINESKE